jgi:hypothetical protein
MVMQDEHRDFSWFRQEKALHPVGGRIYIILHLSACKGVNTRGVNVDPNCVKLGWRYEVYAEVVFYVSSPLS